MAQTEQEREETFPAFLFQKKNALVSFSKNLELEIKGVFAYPKLQSEKRVIRLVLCLPIHLGDPPGVKGINPIP